MKTPLRTEDRTLAAKLRSYDVVSAAIRTHGGQAADVLNGDQTTPEGEPAKDYRPIFTDLGDRLDVAQEGMLEANSTHLGQLARVSELRTRRDEIKEQLLAAFTPARHTLENLYGSTRGFTVVGVAGSTLRDPRGLIKQVRDTVDFLEDPKVELNRTVEEVDVDLPAVATRLSKGADQLELVVAAHAEADKDAETTRLAKNEAIEKYDRQFFYVGRATEGLFDLAGMHDLAERVRPSIRRPGRREDDKGDDKPEAATSEPAPSDDTESVSTDA
ncbi:MAG: hypothetical protein GY719_39535 [bacterium]|nr:hypothetical protein [bacterium]